jgi:predicted patatin/cPLA2 family phospholipase
MVVKAMENRHNEYNETLELIAEREKSGDVLVIRPEETLEIGRIEHNPDVMQKVYEKGRAVAEKRLEEIKNFLK